MTRNCDICGREYEIDDYNKWASLYTNSVETRVWDVKHKRYSIKQYNTCRDCASAVRAYADRLARKYKENDNEQN